MIAAMMKTLNDRLDAIGLYAHAFAVPRMTTVVLPQVVVLRCEEDIARDRLLSDEPKDWTDARITLGIFFEPQNLEAADTQLAAIEQALDGLSQQEWHATGTSRRWQAMTLLSKECLGIEYDLIIRFAPNA